MLKQHYAGAVAVEGLPGEAWRTGEVIFFARGLYVVLVLAPPADSADFLKQLYAAAKD
jgi:hypothetical protein